MKNDNIAALENSLSGVKRDFARLSRGGDLPEGYRILFYGIGNVAREGLKAICHADPRMFDVPISEIYLLGQNKSGSVEARKRHAQQANEILGLEKASVCASVSMCINRNCAMTRASFLSVLVFRNCIFTKLEMSRGLMRTAVYPPARRNENRFM